MRVTALVTRIVRQFVHDKRSLAILFVAPMFILWLMSMVFGGNDYQPKLETVEVPPALVAALENEGALLHETTFDKGMERLENREADALIYMENGRPTVTLEGSDSTANRAVLTLLQNASGSLQPPGAAALNPEVSFLHGSEEMTALDHFGPVLIGFFAFFFVFLLSGIAFLRERTGGTLEKLLSTPLRRWEIVAGYVLGFGLFAAVQAVLIAWFGVRILDIVMEGAFFYVLLITLLLAFSALTLGVFLSAFARNELQMIQFIPLVIVPQVFFSGLFHIESMAEWLQPVRFVLPLYYGADAMREVMVRGQGWSAIDTQIYILLVFSVAMMAANVWALKKYRSI